MAKTKGPLLSEEARGKFGNAIIFQKDKGRSTARMMFTPRNKNTVVQQANRQNITDAVNRWHILFDYQVEWWGLAAKTKKLTMSGYNYFISEYSNSMNVGETPKTIPIYELTPAVPIPWRIGPYFDFSEGAGATTTDKTFGIVADIYGASWVNEGSHYSLSFDGVNDWCDGGNSMYFNLGFSSFTYMVRVFVSSSAGGYDSPFNKGGMSLDGPGFDIELGTGNWVTSINDGVIAFTDDFCTEILGRWVHLAVVIDRSLNTMQLYLDGHKVSTPTNITGLGSVAGSEHFLFSNTSVWTRFKGKIKDFILYDRALDEFEILHNAYLNLL